MSAVAEVAGRVETSRVIVPFSGSSGIVSRYVDVETADLDRLARTWLRMQRERKAFRQMGAPEEIADGFEKLEGRASTLLTRALRRHPLWPWLAQYPGLGGAHVASLVGLIGDPRRFPGQRCSEGHYLPAIYTPGQPCPIVDVRRDADVEIDDRADLAEADATGGIEGRCGLRDVVGASEEEDAIQSATACPGVLLDPRPHSGVRSFWRYLGLDADDEGRAPCRRAGVRSYWNPRGRASVMQPGGIAEQIVRLNVPVYADVYREAKERLNLRIAVGESESDNGSGDAIMERAGEVDRDDDVAGGRGRSLRPFEADRIARKVAAKRFLGDLLIAWKEITG